MPGTLIKYCDDIAVKVSPLNSLHDNFGSLGLQTIEKVPHAVISSTVWWILHQVLLVRTTTIATNVVLVLTRLWDVTGLNQLLSVILNAKSAMVRYNFKPAVEHKMAGLLAESNLFDSNMMVVSLIVDPQIGLSNLQILLLIWNLNLH